jgi:hypothetical protein
MASHKTSNWRPRAIKGKGLLIEEVGREVVVYNLEGYRVHCLNEQAVQIWKLCGGTRTLKQIAVEVDIALDPTSREIVVGSAIAQFESLGLIEPFAGAPALISRRDMARRIGVGAAVAAVPIITSMMAPLAHAAATCVPKGGPCTLNTQCCSVDCNTSSNPPKCK